MNPLGANAVKIARFGVFTGLLAWMLAGLLQYGRGESAAIAEIGIAGLLIGLMWKNPERWIYAVAGLGGLAAILGLVVWIEFSTYRTSQYFALVLFGVVVWVVAPVWLIVAQRRRGEASSARVAHGKLLLCAGLILIAGMLSQVAWRFCHVAYLVPKAWAATVPPRWQMWLVDITVGWQANYGLWSFLLGLAYIVTVGAQLSGRFRPARIFLAGYLSLLVVISAGYVSAR